MALLRRAYLEDLAQPTWRAFAAASGAALAPAAAADEAAAPACPDAAAAEPLACPEVEPAAADDGVAAAAADLLSPPDPALADDGDDAAAGHQHQGRSSDESKPGSAGLPTREPFGPLPTEIPERPQPAAALTAPAAAAAATATPPPMPVAAGARPLAYALAAVLVAWTALEALLLLVRLMAVCQGRGRGGGTGCILQVALSMRLTHVFPPFAPKPLGCAGAPDSQPSAAGLLAGCCAPLGVFRRACPGDGAASWRRQQRRPPAAAGVCRLWRRGALCRLARAPPAHPNA